MHRTFTVLSLLALAACGVEPDAVERGDAADLLWETNLDIGGLLTLERCFDGVDNDGDNLVDTKDPDCAQGGVFGGGGFWGGAQEGTGISDPFRPGGGTIELFGERAEWSYTPGDERDPTVLTFVHEVGRDLVVTEIQLEGRVIDSFQTVSSRSFGDSLIVTTRDGGAFLAPGPIDDTLFLERW